MKQYFRGRLEGYYVGHPRGDRYRLQVYRASVRDIELIGDPTDAPAPQAADKTTLYQAEVTDAALLGIAYAGSQPHVLHGAIYEVHCHSLDCTHSTKHNGKTYGRLVGRVQAYAKLPEPPAHTEDDLAPLTHRSLPTLTAEQDKHDARGPDNAPSVNRSASQRPPAPELSPAPPPRPKPPLEIPFVFISLIAGLILGLTVGGLPTLAWFAVLAPTLLLRFLLDGAFSPATWHRIVGAIFVGAQAICFVVIALDWWTDGCKSTSLVPFVVIPAMTFLSGFLPSPISLLCTAIGYAGMLVISFSGIVHECDLLPDRDTMAPRPPSVESPGKPRTNSDGSWPRRPGT